MRKFKLWHSVAGASALLAAELVALLLWHSPWLIVACAAAGAVGLVYVATEVVEEVRSAKHMLVLLSAVIAEFIVFFSLQYACLLAISPLSFSALRGDAISLLLHSIMVLVFNPLYLPVDDVGRALLLVNTAGALGLVMFIFQNINQFRRSLAT